MHLHSIRQPPTEEAASIVVPYTELHPTVRAVLVDVYNLSPRFVHVPNPDSYWRLFKDLWAARETVVIVEHDVLPWPGAIDELLGCSSIWCSLSYKISTCRGRVGYGIHHAFGCCKITAELMQILPDVWDEIGNHDWHFLDSQFCDAALRAGLVPHPHRPPAIHLKLKQENVSRNG